MARSKIEDRFIRKLTRTGGGKSVSVVLPIEFVRKLKWRDRQKVEIFLKGSKIIIEDWSK